MQGMLKAGSARIDITPPLGTRIAGSFRPRYAEQIDDPLFAKALVLENGTTRIALVTCDLIAIPEHIAEAAKARIAERCGIPAAHVMINATHTHTAPAVADLLGVDAETAYCADVPFRIADAVECAVQRLQQARIGFASADEGRISFNRRWKMKDGTVRMNPGVEHPDRVAPTGPIDPQVAMLFVEATDGTPISAVVNFSLHYVGTDNGAAISADYFGHFDRLMQRYLGASCIALLWNAASGQINNIDYSGERRWTHRGHQQALKMANVLAGHLLTEMPLMVMQEEVALSGELATLRFRRKQITEADLQTAERILSAPEGSPFRYDTGPFDWVVGQPIPQSVVDVYARECQRLAKLPLEMSTPLQVLRLGAAAIIAIPGEVFVETGLRIKADSDAHPLFLVSLANGYIGYICTDRALRAEGGYETWAALSSLPDIGTTGEIERVVSALLDKE